MEFSTLTAGGSSAGTTSNGISAIDDQGACHPRAVMEGTGQCRRQWHGWNQFQAAAEADALGMVILIGPEETEEMAK